MFKTITSFIIFALLSLGLTAEAKNQIIATKDSPYGELYIYEDSEHNKCLAFENPNKATLRQSCSNISDPEKLIFSYQKMALGSLYLQNNPKNILIIGLGGNNLPKALNKLLPKARIEVVEINPGVVEVAKEHFGLVESDNLIVKIEDGIEFIAKARIDNKLYDLIILDAYNAKGIPAPFLADNFLQNLKATVSKDGVIVINTIQHRSSYRKETDLFFSYFGQFYNLLDNNRVVIAKNGHLSTKFQIEAVAKKLDADFKNLGIDTKWLLPKFTTYPLGSVIFY